MSRGIKILCGGDPVKEEAMMSFSMRQYLDHLEWFVEANKPKQTQPNPTWQTEL